MPMTVSQLKELLESFPDDMEVKFAYNYGDHGRTMVAADINVGEERFVKHSDYHNMDQVVDTEEQEDGDEGDPVPVDKGATQALVLCASQF